MRLFLEIFLLKRSRILLPLFIFLLSASISWSAEFVQFIQLNNDTINPATAEYITRSIDQAYKKGAVCLVIKLDTPGGLLDSTRVIVKKMLIAPIPIVVYISPDGSRAGSAGVFITYASHIAAMAPSTNIGAAHPVQMGVEKPKTDDWKELREMIKDLKEEQSKEVQKKKNPEEKEIGDEDKSLEKAESSNSPLEDKILNDTVAFIKSIAHIRHRNVDWAVLSVTKSSSITAEEALEKKVVDLIAKDDQDLLVQLDGRAVSLGEKNVVLHTKDAVPEYVQMGFRQNFFNVLANPNIAYILFILGFYALLFELTHPGAGFPGVVGAIFLILAFYSMQTLPTNYAGLALLILGLCLLVAEAFIPGFGLLTLGGLVCSILGGMLLFESTDPMMRISTSLLLGFSLTTGVLTFFVLRLIIQSRRRRRVKGGKEGLIGEKGEAQTQLLSGKTGKVFLHGEIWDAVSREEINKGEHIEVVSVEGMLLHIKKL